MPATIPVRHAIAITMIAGTLLFAACDDPEEDVTGETQSSVAPSSSAPRSSAATPPPSIASTAPSTTLAVTPPADWKQYENDEMGISIHYPPDLAVRSESGPAHNEYGGQDVDIRSPDQMGRGFLVSTFEANPYNLTLDQFADEFYCARDKREATLAGAQARSCIREGLPDRPVSVVVAEHGERFYAISASVEVTNQELSMILQSFQFLPLS